MNILVTGGCGFIGSHFIEEALKCESTCIFNIDCLTYSANNNLSFSKNKRYKHINLSINEIEEKHFEKIDYVVHFAAESHVDNSIKNSDIFIKTNINGTFNLINKSKNSKIKKFIHVSTDEVFGCLNKEQPAFTPQSPYRPNNPYSASKASSDLIVRSFIKTHSFPGIITNCSNNYGPRQFPEKLIPLAVQKLVSKQPIPIYGAGENIRDWIYVKDHVNALLLVMLDGKIGSQYLIGGENEIKNLDLIKKIIKIYQNITNSNLGWNLYEFIEDRKGHDFRYSIDNSYLRKELKVFNLSNFDSSLTETIKWYINHYKSLQ